MVMTHINNIISKLKKLYFIYQILNLTFIYQPRNFIYCVYLNINKY